MPHQEQMQYLIAAHLHLLTYILIIKFSETMIILSKTCNNFKKSIFLETVNPHLKFKSFNLSWKQPIFQNDQPPILRKAVDTYYCNKGPYLSFLNNSDQILTYKRNTHSKSWQIHLLTPHYWVKIRYKFANLIHERILFGKSSNIIFMYLLHPIIVKNIKKILGSNPELLETIIFGPILGPR